MAYLVIQGLEVETSDLKEIAKLCGASRIENIGNAFRLHEYKLKHGVAEYCAKVKLDFAFVPQVAAITASAMRGEIEYHESLRRRLALLEGMDESALQRVYDERLKLSPGAERMLERLRSLRIKTLLVSSGFTFFTERLKERLSLDYTLS